MFRIFTDILRNISPTAWLSIEVALLVGLVLALVNHSLRISREKLKEAEAERRRIEAKAAADKQALGNLVVAIETTLERNSRLPPLHVWADRKSTILKACEAYRAGLEGQKQQELDLVLREFNGLGGHNLAWNMSDANNAFTPGAGAGVPVEAGYVTGRALLAQALGRILEFARAG